MTRRAFFLLWLLSFPVPSFTAPAPAEVKFLVQSRGERRSLPSEVASSARLLADYPSMIAIAVPRAAKAHVRQALATAGFNVTELEDVIRTPRRVIASDVERPESAPFSAGLFLVQAVAPATPDWQAAIDRAGLTVIESLAERTVIVSGTAMQLRSIDRLPWIQYIGPYLPLFKFAPKQASDESLYTVQLADTPDSARSIQRVESLVGGFIVSSRRENRITARFRSDLAQVEEILADPFTLGVEAYVAPQHSDERQGLGVAGQLPKETGGGPRYLSWLAGKGIYPNGLTRSKIVVDVVDTGVDRGCDDRGFVHRDLYGRGVYHKGIPGTDSFEDKQFHGTIVASIIAGVPGYGLTTDGRQTLGHEDVDQAGLYYGLGIAPGVRIGSTRMQSASIFGMTVDEMTRHAMTSRCVEQAHAIPCTYSSIMCPATVQNYSSNSYAVANAGTYTTESQQFDQNVRNAGGTGQSLTITMSAGNFAQNAGDSTATVMAPATAKNVITVGATESVRPSDPRCDDQGGILRHSAKDYNVLAYVSRRGTSDGRLKPDLLAPGTLVSGARSFSSNTVTACLQYSDPTDLAAALDPQYIGSSGTSYSAPVAAGSIALLKYMNQSQSISPAMYKAILVGGARSIHNAIDRQTGLRVGAWPNAQQGFGRISLVDVLAPFPYRGGNLDQTIVLQQGQTWWTYLDFTDQAALAGIRIVLVWTDKEGATGSGKTLVNDLDLTVTINGDQLVGNAMQSDGWSLPNPSSPQILVTMLR